MADRNQTTEFGLKYIWATQEGMMVMKPHSDFIERHVQDGKIDPFASDGTVQKWPLGTELWYADRRFRYAKAGGTALVTGKLYQSVVPLAGHIDEVVGEPAAGDTTIAFTPNTVTTDDLAANQLADGYLYINDDTGEGYMYRIKSHPAILGGASGTITLYDPIVVTLGSGATATVLHNPYRGIIVHPSPATAKLAGVAVYPVPANEFGWIQYRGPCAVLTGGTIVISDVVVPSTATDGAVMASAAIETDGPVIGEVMAVNADTEHSAIYLAMP